MFEVFEHTSDVGLRIQASSLDELFVEAGRGLFYLIAENVCQVRPEISASFDCQASTLEDLLFDFLSELLYVFEARKLLPGKFNISITDGRLHAEVLGETLDPARHELSREVKAITYHQLSVKQTSDGWTATVIVDV